MLHPNTITEIRTNENPGVEYEIALFYMLLQDRPEESSLVLEAIDARNDRQKVMDIISFTDPGIIMRQLDSQGMSYADVSFETQNDEVGPADLVLYVGDASGSPKQIGISVKYANTCTLNVTGRNFITDAQIAELRALLPSFTEKYIDEMTRLYGDVENWFRKRKPSTVTDAFIDMIREAVIQNWPNVPAKKDLLSALFHADSPIDFWVVTYGNGSYKVKTRPQTVESHRADDVTVSKMDTSYVAFYLDGRRVGHMQVKFNNGFVERCKKARPDVVWQGVPMSYGRPFSSWNFSVEQ